jgi:hypothetical protein
MTIKLNQSDYTKILNYYNLTIPKNKTTLKNRAEQVLSDKLCRCIKKVGNSVKSEPRSIGICTKSIFKRKGLKRGRFTCRKNGQRNNKPFIELGK